MHLSFNTHDYSLLGVFHLYKNHDMTSLYNNSILNNICQKCNVEYFILYIGLF